LLLSAGACLQHGGRSYQSTSVADAGAQQQTRRPPLLLVTDGTYRQADGRTPGGFIDAAPHAPFQSTRIRENTFRNQNVKSTLS